MVSCRNKKSLNKKSKEKNSDHKDWEEFLNNPSDIFDKDKLENKKFILKAPEQIVTQFKNQEQEIKYSIEKIEQIIDTIN